MKIALLKYPKRAAMQVRHLGPFNGRFDVDQQCLALRLWLFCGFQLDVLNGQTSLPKVSSERRPEFRMCSDI